MNALNDPKNNAAEHDKDENGNEGTEDSGDESSAVDNGKDDGNLLLDFPGGKLFDLDDQTLASMGLLPEEIMKLRKLKHQLAERSREDDNSDSDSDDSDDSDDDKDEDEDEDEDDEDEDDEDEDEDEDESESESESDEEEDTAGSIKLDDLTAKQVFALMSSAASTGLQLPQYAQAFLANNVTGSTLLHCEDVEDLQELGVQKRVFCKQVLKKIEEYKSTGVPAAVLTGDNGGSGDGSGSKNSKKRRAAAAAGRQKNRKKSK
jgi:hypothetical protein